MWCGHYDFVLHTGVGVGYTVQNCGPVEGSNSLDAELGGFAMLFEILKFRSQTAGSRPVMVTI